MYSRIKDVITDILGFVLFGLSIYMWYSAKIEWLQAITMMAFGSIFFLVSDAGIAKILADKLGSLLDAVGKRISGKNDSD